MSYPSKDFTIGVLLKVAEQAGKNSSCEHPEDIASSMINAIEQAAETVWILHRSGYLKESK